jgi:hypothetical protein
MFRKIKCAGVFEIEVITQNPSCPPRVNCSRMVECDSYDLVQSIRFYQGKSPIHSTA